MRFATDREISRWDELLASNPDGGHILQTRAWGEFKAAWGWRPRYVIDEGTAAGAQLYLSRPIAGLGELWYAPKGPGIAMPDQMPHADALRELARDAFLVKVEPELEEACDTTAWEREGYVKAPRDVQITRATIIVDISPNDETLLASFKSKTRYNIRLAAKRGVVVRHLPVDDNTCDVMFRLMSATQSRAGFTLRRRDYFSQYWQLQHASGQGDFLFAFLGDEVLAGIFVTRFGSRAWYKDGGSSRRHQDCMAPYAVQWETMRWLRERGVRAYDLVAVPRPSELSEHHPLYGLQRFKSGFSETVTEFVGTWDLPLSERKYAIWNRLGERVMHQWTLRSRNDLFY